MAKQVIALISSFFISGLMFEVQAQTDIPDTHPNYGYYQYRNQFYNENATLGWAKDRVKENLNRGVVAVPRGNDEVYVGWRLLAEDPDNITFNVYRSSDGGEKVKINSEPIHRTNIVDTDVPLDQGNKWWVTSVIDGKEIMPEEGPPQDGGSEARGYQTISLRSDIDGKGIHKMGIGDLNGDGTYDFVVKRPGGRVDPGRAGRSEASFKVEAYDGQSGEFMWRKDLGWNIAQGTWYSPMVVFDFNGDGKSEVALKTASYAASLEESFINENDRIIEGPEYLSVLNGETGEEIDKTDWIPRGKPEHWGDHSGNRMNRNMLGVAYLDGKTPSIIMLRGIYGLQKMQAWYLEDGKLVQAWRWTNQMAGWRYQGQSGHNIDIGDIDEDGKDEILYGSIAIDNDGKTLWSTGYGHTDEFYLTDVDPQRLGLEIWYSYEDPHPQNGIGLWDAYHKGDLIFGTNRPVEDDQVDEALVADIDPRYPGMECWGKQGHYYTARGHVIKGEVPPTSGDRTLVWWDDDPLREFYSYENGTVEKWRGPMLTGDIEGWFIMSADLYGDWREEIITYTDDALRIYSTTIPTTDRRISLMQDPLYRIDVALNAQGYYQVPMTSYFLGVIGRNAVTE
ncbi:MAG: silent information regulator protein Sir2 [Candidatus Marinimicrobia bacterium]|nr:silent information regulator protein Sir2 [Candidatus Neomarinimicrobiota bacterium]MCF7830283.1 silent information regulator protein Sir2 [Candidatus Neomarinimicrobiota bacterium]MCF7882192.1 silent information regulator protein Sir2 [Candidatus Neomarinimicrobiota bacterium]